MKRTMSKRMIIMLVSVGGLFAAIIGYQMFVASMMKKFLASNAQPPATVTAMQVKRETWQPQLSAVGNLRAFQGIEVSSEVAGVVKKNHIHSGDWVKKGDLLIELSSDEEAAQLQAMKASRKLAEINFKRDQEQFDIHAISQSQLDASQANVTSARAQQFKQQAIVDKKRIRAPFAGRLGVSQISEGQFINPAEPLVSLQDSSSLYVDFSLPQKHVHALKAGLDITVASAQNGELLIKGLITAINSSVDLNTRNVLIEGKIANSDGLMLPGMFVNVKIDMGKPQQLLTLPQTAISFNAYGSTLFVAKAEKGQANLKAEQKLLAQQVFVKTGDKRGDQVAILEGIKEGDTVVTSGQLKLKNGTPLIINNNVLPANAPAPKPQEH